MVFPSLVLMLDSVRKFILSNESKFSFAGVGASFRVDICRNGPDRFDVLANGTKVGSATRVELIRATWNGAHALLETHRDAAGANGADLDDAERDFMAAFHHEL
jgi:hypothetical protein